VIVVDPKRWRDVDHYFASRTLRPDAMLEAALEHSTAAGLPPIHVAANQGKMLMLWAQMMGAKRILEIGTLGGYSTIWLAHALPSTGGTVATLEVDPWHALVAQDNVTRAGLRESVEIRVGDASATLEEMIEAQTTPFDFIFIDADKPRNPVYLKHALTLSRPGSVIVVDNVVRGGAVIDAASEDPKVRGVRQMMDIIHGHPKLDATVVQSVGAKGYDGWVLARVLE